MKKITLKKLQTLLNNSNSELEKEVIEDAIEAFKGDYTSYMEDVTKHGCISGCVGKLIYYTDTEKFYNKHQHEIHDFIASSLEEGTLTPQTLAAAFKHNFSNWAAWFAYETTAYNILTAHFNY